MLMSISKFKLFKTVYGHGFASHSALSVSIAAGSQQKILSDTASMLFRLKLLVAAVTAARSCGYTVKRRKAPFSTVCHPTRHDAFAGHALLETVEDILARDKTRTSFDCCFS